MAAFTLLLAFSTLLPYGVSSVKLRGKVVLDLAAAFNIACVRLLHASEGHENPRDSFPFLKAMMESSQKGTNSSSKLVSTSSVSFERVIAESRGQMEMARACHKPLEVVFSNRWSKEKFSRLCNSHIISRSKWIIFLDEEYNEESFLDEAAVPFDAQVLTATYNHGGFSIREVYRVNSTFPLQVVSLGRWVPEDGLLIRDLERFYKRRSNLHGIVLRTGSIQNWPVSGFVTNALGQCILDGFFPRVWKELEYLLNISSINLRSEDNSTGNLSPTGDWNGLLGMLAGREIDIIVSELNMNEERTKLMDFTHPLLRTSYQVYFRTTGYDLAWGAVLKPFNPLIWVSLIAWILIGAAALTVCYVTSRPFQTPSDMSLSPYCTLFFMLQSVCQQGYSQVPTSVACRFIFLLAYVLSAVIIPSYSASLVSSLTAPSPNKPFDSLKEMLSYGKYKLLVPERTAEYAYFSTAKNELYKEVYEKLIQTARTFDAKTSSDAAVKVCDRDVSSAIFGVESTLDLKMETLRTDGCEIAKFSQPLSKVSQSIGLLKGNPYTEIIDYYIGNMFSAGIIDRIQRGVWPLKPAKHESTYKQVAFTTSGVFQVFTCLGCGIAISIMILCLEIVTAKRKYLKPSTAWSASKKRTPINNHDDSFYIFF